MNEIELRVPKSLPGLHLEPGELTFVPRMDPLRATLVGGLATLVMLFGLSVFSTFALAMLTLLIATDVAVAVGVASTLFVCGTVGSGVLARRAFDLAKDNHIRVRQGEVRRGPGEGSILSLAPIRISGEPGYPVNIVMGSVTLVSWPWGVRPPLADIYWMGERMAELAGVDLENTCDEEAWEAHTAKVRARPRQRLQEMLDTSHTRFAHLHEIPAVEIASTQAFDSVGYIERDLASNMGFSPCMFKVGPRGLVLGHRTIQLAEIERVVVYYKTSFDRQTCGVVQVQLTTGDAVTVASGAVHVSSMFERCGQLHGVAAILDQYVGDPSRSQGTKDEVPEHLRRLRNASRN